MTLKEIIKAFPLAVINASDDDLDELVSWINEERNSRGLARLVPESEVDHNAR